jgi:hypothetical protein
MSFKKRHTIDPSENQNGNRTVEDQIRRVSIADNGSYQF